MKLIIGLGNPGNQFQNTRHNSGFEVLELLASQYEEKWHEKTKLSSFVAQLVIDAEPVLLLKPQTFYNDSGLSARAAKDFFKIDDKDILVIHDDLALPLGTIRTRQDGGDAGNNGIKSVNAHLGANYARIRIGIGQEDRKTNDVDFVLGTFNATEVKKLPLIHKQTLRIIHDFVADIFTPTSYNVESVSGLN